MRNEIMRERECREGARLQLLGLVAQAVDKIEN